MISATDILILNDGNIAELNGSVARFINFTKSNYGNVVVIIVVEDKFGNSVNFGTLIYKNAIVEVIC